jgi:hypothetical protein
VLYIPGFLSLETVTSKIGKGNYCLFQGDLSVEENIFSVQWIVNNIYENIEMPLIIAGKNPPKSLLKSISLKKNISLIANPTLEKMETLLENAQVVLVPTFSQTGLKIKVIQSLYKGRFCLGNTNAGLGFECNELITKANSKQDYQKLLLALIQKNFTKEEVDKRQQNLEAEFNHTTNAALLLKWLH